MSESIKEYVSIHIDADGHRKSVRCEFKSKNTSNFLTVLDGSEVMIEHDIYMLSPETAEITLRINETITYPDFDIRNITVPSFQPIPYIPEFIPHYITQSIGISTSIITIGIVGVLVYLIMRVRKLQKQMSHVLRSVQHELYLLFK